MASSDQQLRHSRLVFYSKDLDRIDRILNEFLRLSKGQCVLLVDKEGHMITRAGITNSFNEDTISALVAGSFSATREMARLLGEEQFSAMYHQGQRDNIQLSLVGNRTILTVVFNDQTTLGMVRLYVTDAVRKLEELFVKIDNERVTEEESSETQAVLGAFQNSAQGALDAYFKS